MTHSCRPIRSGVAALALIAVLAGCQSDESRLAEHLETALALMDDGDHARAILAYRNALKIDPDHPVAREGIARSYLAQGAIGEAKQNFTDLVERYPDRLDLRGALGEIALVRSDWAALERQTEAMLALDPDAGVTQTLDLAHRYRIAARDNADDARAKIGDAALARLGQAPDDPVLLRVAVAELMERGEPAKALPPLDRALAIDPRQPELQLLRIRLLTDEGRLDAAQDRLLDLAQLYPGDLRIANLLVARHISQGQTREAEAVLRALADSAPADDADLPTLLVEFLRRTEGAEAALAELARRIKAAGSRSVALSYTALDRSIRFDLGFREAAIADLTAMLEGEAAATPQARMLRVLLARMHDKQGDRARARDLVEAVLAADPGEVDALRLRAIWAIEEDKPRAAIVDLRGAIAQRPRDSEVMTLLAAAHAQNGTRGLALEQLAQAATVSGHAARETERYARALLSDDRSTVAMRVLDIAHLAAPGDLGLAVLLAELKLAQDDDTGLASVLAAIRRIDDPAAQEAHDTLLASARLKRGERVDPVLDAVGDVQGPAALRLIDGLTARGDVETARAVTDRALFRAPADSRLRLRDASLLEAEGDLDGAEAVYRTLLAEGVEGDAPALGLFDLLARQGRLDDATIVLADALTRHPTSRTLRLLEADRLQAGGDRIGALALLEALHGDWPRDPVIANNLAALLSHDGASDADIARAARIAAPLRGSANPAVSDTVGWIAHLRGDSEGALPYLRRAAQGLPDDPSIQIRLGRVYAQLGETQSARRAFGAAIVAATRGDPRREEARIRLSALDG